MIKIRIKFMLVFLAAIAGKFCVAQELAYDAI